MTYTQEVRLEKSFGNLMKVIESEENMLLGYRNFKRNNGSYTAGADGLTIKDIEKCSREKSSAESEIS